MKKGRKPKPTAIKKLEGNPGRRPLPENEPEYPFGTTCPNFMPVYGRSEWKRLYPILVKARVLTRADRVALAGYCEAYARWRRAVEYLDKAGTDVYMTPSGTLRPLPHVTIAANASDQMRKWASTLGITPSNRTRIEPIPDKAEEADPLAEFLAGAGPDPQTEGDAPN